MIKSIILVFGKLVRMVGYALSKLSQFCDYANKSKLMQKGTDRNLYKTRFNDLFWLNKTGYVDQCIINSGVFEEHSTRIARRLIKEGDTVLDVGANIGYYSVMFSKLVGETGKVFAFEPTKFFGTVLRMNLEANGCTNVAMFKLGLSNKDQELIIQIGDSSASLHVPGKRALRTEEIIELKTLDGFIEEYKPQKIDFVKVDVDGHEPAFLEGAWKTLERYDPTILIEISHLHYLEAGYTAWGFYDLLKNKKYRIYSEDNFTEFKTKEDFLIKCGNFNYSANIILSKKELKA